MPRALRVGSPEEIIKRVHTRALLEAEKALLRKGEKGYDGTGDGKWADVSVRVKIGVMLAGKAMDKHQDDLGAKREFGLLVMQGKIKDPQAWEKFAAEADKPAIEATVVKEIEGK